jgi:hypothetical protein
MMLHHVDPSQVDTFKDALVIKFATDAIGILEPADTAPTQPIEPEPTAPTAPSAPVAPDTDPVIDVEVTTDTPAADEPIKPAVKTAVDIETLLNKMSLADIRKLAKAKGSDARGNRVNIAARLKKIVTESDIWDATA